MGGGGIWGGRTSPKDMSPDPSLLWMKEAMGSFAPVKTTLYKFDLLRFTSVQDLRSPSLPSPPSPFL